MNDVMINVLQNLGVPPEITNEICIHYDAFTHELRKFYLDKLDKDDHVYIRSTMHKKISLVNVRCFICDRTIIPSHCDMVLNGVHSAYHFVKIYYTSPSSPFELNDIIGEEECFCGECNARVTYLADVLNSNA